MIFNDAVAYGKPETVPSPCGFVEKNGSLIRLFNKVFGNRSNRFRQLVDRYTQQIDAWMLAWLRAGNK